MMNKSHPNTKLPILLWTSAIILAYVSIIPISTCTQVAGTLLNASVDPGEIIKHEIILKADEADPSMDYKAEIFDFGIGPDGANWEIDPDSDTSPYSATKFLRITPTSFHLDAGQSQSLILEGQIPFDAEAGSRYALVSIKSEPINSTENKNIGIVIAFQIPVLLTLKKGDLVDTGEITAVNVTGDQQISVWFKNTGNHHYKAQAEAILKDRDGNVLANATSMLSTSSIIPTYSWQFKLPFKEDFSSGAYTINATVIKSDGIILDSKEEIIKL